MEQCGTECLKWPFLPPPAIEGPEGGLVDPVRTRRFVCLTEEQVMIKRRLEMHVIAISPRLKHQRVSYSAPTLTRQRGHWRLTIRRRVGLVHGMDLLPVLDASHQNKPVRLLRQRFSFMK